MRISCNTCKKEFKLLKDLNDSEYEEYKEMGWFDCSDCICREMEDEK